jgi:rhodanese-related sulfurtransferase
LISENESILNEIIERIAKIGYENQIALAFVMDYGDTEMNYMNIEYLKTNQDAYTIIDIRNYSEVKANKIFANAIHIPLYELRERTNEIPFLKPIVVHCAGGYRSVIAASLLKRHGYHNLRNVLGGFGKIKEEKRIPIVHPDKVKI